MTLMILAVAVCSPINRIFYWVSWRCSHKIRRTRFGRVKLTMISINRLGASELRACTQGATANTTVAHGSAAARWCGVAHTTRSTIKAGSGFTGKTHTAAEQQMATDESMNRHTHNHQLTTHNLHR